jgi:hypothetical protein
VNVEKRTPFYVAASFSLAIFGAACSEPQVGGRASSAADPTGSASASGGNVSVEGCLNGGPDGRVVLTAAPGPAVTTAARPGMGERDTHSYVLVGGQNLQQHFGKRVAVSGTLMGRGDELEREMKTEAQAKPTGTTGGDKPTVETKAEVDLEVRQLNVAEVREVSPTCQVNP